MNDSKTSFHAGESLSALVDGEGDTQAVLQAMTDSLPMGLRADWNTYQTIGDVLRAPRAATAKAEYGADRDFVQRLMLRLESESIGQPDLTSPPGMAANRHVAAANDTTFRWKLVAGFASFGAMAAVAWTLAGVPAAAPEQLANSQASTERVVASPQGPMVRDARLEELLSAHKQMSSTSLQVPPGFLRNAGFESPSKGQR